jgi:hypothetical protein
MPTGAQEGDVTHAITRLALPTIGLLAGLCAGLEAQTPKPLDPRCEKLLPAESANRLTGRSDLVLVPRRHVTGAGGTCNYARNGKMMVFLFTILDEKSHAAERYAHYRLEPEYRAHQRDIAGLGDAAFTGGTYEHELVARKGSRILMLSSMLSIDRAAGKMSALVGRDALVAVAREVMPKL